MESTTPLVMPLTPRALSPIKEPPAPRPNRGPMPELFRLPPPCARLLHFDTDTDDE